MDRHETTELQRGLESSSCTDHVVYVTRPRLTGTGSRRSLHYITYKVYMMKACATTIYIQAHAVPRLQNACCYAVLGGIYTLHGPHRFGSSATSIIDVRALHHLITVA
jgi:hypothetical protein